MTLENAWKAAARHWWERLNETRGEARMWQQATAHACRSVELREKETEAFRAVNHELSLARDKAENERDIANTCADVALKNARILESNQVANDEEVARVIRERDALLHRLVSHRNDELAPLVVRIVEADRKHPRDLHDGCCSQETARNKLASARENLRLVPSWTRALECEVAEVVHGLAIADADNVVDELLDVATVALRWRRAILERGK